jgi:hypothetical protein
MNFDATVNQHLVAEFIVRLYDGGVEVRDFAVFHFF